MTTQISPSGLQDFCEQGQRALMAMRYWDAEKLLSQSEQIAWNARDYDTLARLYMPLQEARRQRRQRCAEGIVALDLVAQGPADIVEARHILGNYRHGQLLVAGWGTIRPAIEIRELAQEHNLYVETFLAAIYPVGSGRAVVIAPTADVALPPIEDIDIDTLIHRLPPHCIVLPESQLPQGARKGTAQTYAQVMDLWEHLHGPFMAMADQTPDPAHRLAAYRRAIQVDYACELAHQKLSDTARELDRMA